MDRELTTHNSTYYLQLSKKQTTMKTLNTQISALLILLVSLTTLSGCTEDWWDTAADMDGRWRIVEVSNSSSNYREGDTWTLYSSGTFIAQGYPDLYEEGYWEQRGRNFYISFKSYEPEIEAYIRGYEGDYMVLDVTDYTYHTYYTLRLVRESYMSQEKAK